MSRTVSILGLGYVGTVSQYICNAGHAVKLSFANELGTMASSVGVDAESLVLDLVNLQKTRRPFASKAYEGLHW